MLNSFFKFRDLKPENFMLKYEDDASVIKLIDFGMSRRLESNELLSDPDGTVIIYYFKLDSFLKSHIMLRLKYL